MSLDLAVRSITLRLGRAQVARRYSTWHTGTVRGSPGSQEVAHLDASDDGEEDKPEPEEDVNLLVDDVER